MSFAKEETLGQGIEKDIMVQFIRRLLNRRAYLLIEEQQLPAAKIAIGGRVVRFLRDQGHNTTEEAIGWAAGWNLEELEELEEEEEEEDPDFDEEVEDNEEMEDDEEMAHEREVERFL